VGVMTKRDTAEHPTVFNDPPVHAPGPPIPSGGRARLSDQPVNPGPESDT